MATNELESRLNSINLKYRKKKIAIIEKIPVPIEVTKKGMVAKSSTVDYIGNYKGQYLCFDAKETLSKTSFPLANVKQHQLTFLDIQEQLGAKSFFLIHFKKLYKDEAFVTPVSLVYRYRYNETRKSIPISEFSENWLTPINDYLIYFNKMNLNTTTQKGNIVLIKKNPDQIGGAVFRIGQIEDIVSDTIMIKPVTKENLKTILEQDVDSEAVGEKAYGNLEVLLQSAISYKTIINTDDIEEVQIIRD